MAKKKATTRTRKKAPAAKAKVTTKRRAASKTATTRRAKIADKIDRFIDELTQYPNVREAAKAAGLDRSEAYRRRQADQRFRQRWEEAIRIGRESAEDVLHEAAIKGLETVKTVAGEREVVREVSIDALKFLLRAHWPERYGDRKRIDVHASAEPPTAPGGLATIIGDFIRGGDEQEDG